MENLTNNSTDVTVLNVTFARLKNQLEYLSKPPRRVWDKTLQERTGLRRRADDQAAVSDDMAVFH